MKDPSTIEIRPARWVDADRVAEFLRAAPATAEESDAPDLLVGGRVRTRVVAVSDGEIVGTCLYTGGAGHCAVIPPPRMLPWDETLAARLVRGAAALAARKHRARLIQALTEPEGTSPLAKAVERAGFERLAVLSYMRRPIRSEDRFLALPPDLEWRNYSLFTHRQFARTITMTYVDSLDCPRLAGLRPVNDTIETHKRTGAFSPRTWRLAAVGREPVGVGLLNENQGRGDLVYLGVVPAARHRGIGRALLARAVRDTAEMDLPQMGLAVDVSNTPAMRLYESAGFREIRRRLAWFVPGGLIEAL